MNWNQKHKLICWVQYSNSNMGLSDAMRDIMNGYRKRGRWNRQAHIVDIKLRLRSNDKLIIKRYNRWHGGIKNI